MKRRVLARSAGSLVLAAVAGAAQAQEARPHRIVLHVGSADPAMMRVALNNIANAHEAYAALGQTVAIELVANGPGYAMLRADTTPVAERLSEIHTQYPATVFSACQATRRGLAAAEHKTVQDIPQVAQARAVPAGVVRLTELQEGGWSYVRV